MSSAEQWVFCGAISGIGRAAGLRLRTARRSMQIHALHCSCADTPRRVLRVHAHIIAHTEVSILMMLLITAGSFAH